MTDDHITAAASSTANADDDHYYGAALGRIRNFMLVLGPVLCVGAGVIFGWRTAVGFLLGCVIAYLNFQWLKSGVSTLADRVANSGKPRSGKGIVARFLLRYVLLGVAAYAILTSFPASLRGLFAGLFLPVGAIVCEAGYEVYAAIRGDH